MAKKIRRSHRAQNDIEHLFRYSLHKFGPRQAEAYLARLLRALEALTEFPDLGVPLGDVGKGRRLIHESHVIYYRVSQSHVLVLRVLDARRDAGRHLREP